MRWPFVTTIILLAGCVVLGVLVGCAPRRYARLRSLHENDATPQAVTPQAVWNMESVLTERTRRTLHRYDLDHLTERRPSETLVALRRECLQETTPDLVFAFAEIAYHEAARLERSRPRLAAEMYIASAQYAYHYLFAPKLAALQNEFDPSFREACLFYNRSVENLLRLSAGRDGVELQPGQVYTMRTESGEFRFRCERVSGEWLESELEPFRFASDYEVTGLSQEYRQSGLGVPLMATRRPKLSRAAERPADRYCPPQLTFSASAFLRFTPNGAAGCEAVLELHDPLVGDTVRVAQQRVPLETDLTTPFAYSLAKGSGYAEVIRLMGFFHPDAIPKFMSRMADRMLDDATAKSHEDNSPEERKRDFSGLVMQQPYSPDKIPVVFIHGLGSSPLTWVEMSSSLQSDREMRDRYQFWFFFYPTGQPVWASAALLRQELTTLRDTLDPQRQAKALDEMVLVGHSMGGLLAQMQTIDSGDDIWKLVSARPFDEVAAPLSPSTREMLRAWFFFSANTSIRRVVSLATPYHGSDASNNTTRWLAWKAIKLPHEVDAAIQEVNAKCPDLPTDSLLRLTTSIASLSMSSPILPKVVAMAQEQTTARTAAQGATSVLVAGRLPLETRPPITYHNVIGARKQSSFSTRLFGANDGVVTTASAHLPGATSEVTIVGHHTTLHDEPQAVREVRRVLQMR